MLNSIIPKTETTKFKNESDNKFRINIKMNIEISIANILIETMNSDLE
jgi:hypothetical protein